MIVADTRRPKAFDACLEAVGSVAPWAPQKLTYVDGSTPTSCVAAARSC